MPVNYDRLLAEVRIDLGEPDLSAPTDDLILQKAGDVVQLRFNEQQNSDVGWAVVSRDVATQAGKAVYSIGDPGFGRIVRVHTIDPGQPYHITQKIPLVDRQNIENYYADGPDRARVGGAYHTAVVAVPYLENGEWRLEFVPTPAGTARYRVWFENGEIPEPAPEARVPGISPFWRYFRIATSVACVRYCEWSRLASSAKPDPERWQKLCAARQRQIEEGLLKQEVEFRSAWDDHLTSAWRAGVGDPTPYGGWAEG